LIVTSEITEKEFLHMNSCGSELIVKDRKSFTIVWDYSEKYFCIFENSYLLFLKQVYNKKHSTKKQI